MKNFPVKSFSRWLLSVIIIVALMLLVHFAPSIFPRPKPNTDPIDTAITPPEPPDDPVDTCCKYQPVGGDTTNPEPGPPPPDTIPVPIFIYTPPKPYTEYKWNLPLCNDTTKSTCILFINGQLEERNLSR